MNVVDWIVLGIVGISVLIGLYRGFIASVASVGGSLVSLIASYFVTPKLVEWARGNEGIMNTMRSYFSNVAGKIGIHAAEQVSAQSSESVNEIIDNVRLPAPFDSLVKNNLLHPLANGSQTVIENITDTIVNAALHVICFVICFVVLMILFHIIINLLKSIFKFPVLKQMNTAAGGILGLLRGILICFVAFALVPLIQTMLPDNVNQLVETSALAKVFSPDFLIQSIINGRL